MVCTGRGKWEPGGCLSLHSEICLGVAARYLPIWFLGCLAVVFLYSWVDLEGMCMSQHDLGQGLGTFPQFYLWSFTTISTVLLLIAHAPVYCFGGISAISLLHCI